MFKGGLSPVVITLLIIIVSLSSLGVIYSAILPSFSDLDTFSSTTSCLGFLLEISSCEYNDTLTSINIRRGAGSGALDGIRAAFSVNTGQEVRMISSPLPDELEVVNYVWTDVPAPRELDVAAVLGDTLCPLTGSPRTCVEIATLEIMPQCRNGIDNDGDGWIDWPNDPGCDSAEDNDETNGDLGLCANNEDDDSDGFVDGRDPLCLTWQGTRERALCQNNEDDDGDGWIDELDYGCIEDNDDNEFNDPAASPACSDGIDNDGDLLVDRADPECLSGTQDDESSIIIQVFECNDGIDNADSEDTIADYPLDIGCTSPNDSNETNEPLSCPYGNNLTIYATCDYRLALQNAYSALPIETYGVQRTAWSVGAFALKAGNAETLAQMLSYNESQIRTTFRNYLDNRPQIDPTDLFILDIEDELDPELIGSYSGDPVLQAQVIDALRVRVHVARTELPNAQLALWNTVLPDPAGKSRPTFLERLEGYHLAGQRGLFDELDYMLPNVYTRYGVNDSSGNFYSLLNMTRMAIEYSQNITRSDNQTTLPVIPVLSFLVANGGSANQHQPVNHTMARQQVELIQTYPSVEMIIWWSGSDHYSPGAWDVNITGYYASVKPVPAPCFC